MKFSDLTLKAVGKLPDEELTGMHLRCHQLAAGEFCRTALDAHDGLLVPEMERRGVKHDSPLKCEAKKEDRAEGLYLVAPHGRLIFETDGKRGIAKPTFVPGSSLEDLRGEWIILSKEEGRGWAFGEATLGEPEELSLRDFDARYGQHRVSREERLGWWPNARALWVYPVESVRPYANPKEAIIPPGVQTRVRKVELAEKQQTRAEAALDKLAGLPDKFVWIPDFVSVTGSTLYASEDREPRDIDVVLRAEPDGDGFVIRTPVDASFAIKLERLLKEALGDRRVQYTLNAYGPNWTFAPAYDLCLVKRQPLELVEVGEREPEFAAMEYKARTLTPSALDHKLRGASDKIKKQAYQTWKEDKVVPGRMVLSLKPLRPAPAGERQTAGQFYKYIEDNLKFPLYVSPKRDGGTVYASGDGKGKVWLYSDDGEVVTEKLPRLVEALKRCFKDKSFYLGTEVEYWRDKNHYPREAAVGAMKKGDDENLAMNIFRVIYWDGEDVHGKPFEETWELAQKLPTDTKKDGALDPRKDGPINLVPHYKVSSLSELKERLESVAYKPGVEGVVVKRADGDFPLDGEPGDPGTEVKWHKSFAAKFACLGQEETKTEGVYVTWVGLPIEEAT